MNDTYSPVPELNLLKALQDRCGFENYADGFGLTKYADTSGIESWSKDPEFVGSLIPFAQANGTGSMYAIWVVDDRPDLARLPVVVFGDEGGQHVVARDLRELFQLLGYDCEISVDWDSAYFYRGKDYEPTSGHRDYVAWLDQHFDLAPTEDPDAAVETAQAEFAAPFANWTSQFLA